MRVALASRRERLDVRPGSVMTGALGCGGTGGEWQKSLQGGKARLRVIRMGTADCTVGCMGRGGGPLSDRQLVQSAQALWWDTWHQREVCAMRPSCTAHTSCLAYWNANPTHQPNTRQHPSAMWHLTPAKAADCGHMPHCGRPATYRRSSSLQPAEPLQPLAASPKIAPLAHYPLKTATFQPSP